MHTLRFKYRPWLTRLIQRSITCQLAEVTCLRSSPAYRLMLPIWRPRVTYCIGLNRIPSCAVGSIPKILEGDVQNSAKPLLLCEWETRLWQQTLNREPHYMETSRPKFKYTKFTSDHPAYQGEYHTSPRSFFRGFVLPSSEVPKLIFQRNKVMPGRSYYC